MKLTGSFLKAAELNDQWCTGINVGAMGTIVAVETGVGGDYSCRAKFIGGSQMTCEGLFGTAGKKFAVEKNGRLAFFEKAGCDCNLTSLPDKFPKQTACVLGLADLR